MEHEKPVVAAINRSAIRAGYVFALCCDILVADEVAYLAMTEVDVGLAGGVDPRPSFFPGIRRASPDLISQRMERARALPIGMM